MALASIFFGAALTLGAAYGFGKLLLRKMPAPPEIVLGLGAIALSLLVFLLLVVNAGFWYIYLPLGLAFCGASFQPAAGLPPGALRASPPAARKGFGTVAVVIFAAYSIWYFINALAPETLADGITYHLGLPYEYTRLGGFPSRMAFYDAVPQGMEMLHAMAFAFGRHSAAKLIEFAFFLATVPLIFRIGRRLGLSSVGSLVPAVIYFCAPVAGATGASSYNDAAGVFFTLAALYVLLLWLDSGNPRYLLYAGALAGFCYAIKVPGIATVIAAVLFAVCAAKKTPRWKPAVLVAAGAAFVMAPWLIRNAVLTGNPVAPLLNSVFPNPEFHIATEHELAANLRSLGSIKLANATWELAFGGRLDGTFGPLLFALPLGLLALRRRAGRWCWAATVLLALPWFSNSGARFLMPAVAVAAFTLGMVLPPPAAWVAIGIQAVFCWPQIIGAWETRYGFRLHDFPLAAALRIEPEDLYLSRRLDEFKLAKIVEANTPWDAKILGLLGVANAYLARDVRVTWQSAEADRLLDTLRLAALPDQPLFDWKANWPPASFSRLRFRVPTPVASEWIINDVRIYSGEELVYTSPHWNLRAWPNSWEAPLALDGNLATPWRTWEPARAGMYFEIRFDHPQRISSAVLYSQASSHSPAMELFGQTLSGQWIALGRLYASRHRKEDLRAEATLAIRRAGYRYLLVTTGSGGAAPIGNAIVGHEPEWGLEQTAEAGPYHLFRVK